MSTNGAVEDETTGVDDLWSLPGIVDETPRFEDLRLHIDMSKLDWGDLEAVQAMASASGDTGDNLEVIDRVLDAVVDGGHAVVMPLFRLRIFRAILARANELSSPKARPSAMPLPISEADAAAT